MLPSLWSQQVESGQSQDVGWLSNCRSDQLAEHAQGLSPRKTDVGDLCYESQPSLWVECKDRISKNGAHSAHTDHT